MPPSRRPSSRPAAPRARCPLATLLARAALLAPLGACATTSSTADTAPATQATAGASASAATGRAARDTAGGTATGAFVVRLGTDTTVVERYVRTATRLESWSVNRQPATVSRHYVLTLDQGGAPVRMDYEGGRADGSQPMTRATFEFGADTTVATFLRDTARQVVRLPGRGVLPAVGNSFALVELAIARFRAMGVDSAAIPTLPIGGSPRLQPQSIRRTGANAVAFDYFGAPWLVTLDAEGRVLAVDGSRSASKISVERVRDVDVAALTREFVARDKAGRGFGPASPADSVRVTLGDARLAINYSRPARRGRALLGNLVPVDGSVWRTGANAATMFTTSATLDIGGTTVPAGSYTLWTVPSRTGGWQLVLNKQTGQWGTDYDAKQDFARIPMTVNAAAANGPEQFLISIEPTGASTGRLRMTWSDIDVSVPVTVKASAAR